MKKTLITLWVCLFVLQLPAQNFWKRHIRGEGPTITREFDLRNFDGVHNGFACDVELTRGNDYKVVVEGQENIIDNLKLEVEGGNLKIKYDRMVRRADKVTIFITMPALTDVALSGSGNLKTTNHFSNSGDLDVSLSGSGNVFLNIDSRTVDTRMSGSGSVEFDGEAEALAIAISGSGNLNAQDFETKECEVRISGSGNATVYVSDRLDARISGSGNIRYRGNAAKVHSSVSGSGNVRSL